MIGVGAKAQQAERTAQYVVNPYAINDAYLGIDGQAQFFGSYRKQWANITGSPSNASLHVELPITAQFSVGAKLKNNTTGPISETSIGFTGSYEVLFGRRQQQGIRMGMTLGLGNSSVNSTKLDDPNDPAVNNLSPNILFAAASLGMVYRYGEQLELGVSLPRILQSDRLSEEGNTYEIDPFAKVTVNANYTFYIDRRIDFISHVVLYHDAVLGEQLEFLGVFDYEEKLNLGAGYRTDFGVTALFGFDISTIFSLNYAYSAGVTNRFNRTGGSHEIILRVRI